MRERIKWIIDNRKDSEKASIEICLYLDGELDLEGNGWFDDDPEVLEEIRQEHK